MRSRSEPRDRGERRADHGRCGAAPEAVQYRVCSATSTTPTAGAVITEAGTNPNVAGLVYIAAFAPDAGESVNTLIANPPPGAPVPPILPPRDGFLFLDREKFHASFAGDVDDDQAAFMADAQVPWGVEALGGTITEPAWRSKPSWYLVTTEDRMIPPPAQQFMSERAGSTVVEVAASHSVYVSQPAAVAELIEKAASEVPSAVH
jgi:pimeloyl-ACP methyl ester carboxylesterase